MLPLGTKAPDFNLFDTLSKKHLSYNDCRGEKGTVIMFICNHCPYVKHVNDEIIRLTNDYRIHQIGFVAISSNDVENYPEDHPDKMWELARKLNYPFPYLFDETQEVAKSYQAECTPDFYLFDESDELFYRGQLDDSRPKNGIAVSGRNMREALEALLGNQAPPKIQKPSMGCNIKWKK